MRCRETAADEILAGTAPRARWWWLIEVPGSWGRNAVPECRIAAVRELASDEARRVLLVRRPGRHPAVDTRGPLRVWIAGALPDDPPTRLAVADDPEDLLTWPIEGPAWASTDPQAPVLAVCTNASRDLCCGLDGRALVEALGDVPGVWESSHLGGHRFAPTALLVPHGLVYGRLTPQVAHDLIMRGPSANSAPWLRGRSALSPSIQASEAALLASGAAPDPARVTTTESDTEAIVHMGDLPPVRLARTAGPARPVSCGGDDEPCTSWQVQSGA